MRATAMQTTRASRIAATGLGAGVGGKDVKGGDRAVLEVRGREIEVRGPVEVLRGIEVRVLVVREPIVDRGLGGPEAIEVRVRAARVGLGVHVVRAREVQWDGVMIAEIDAARSAAARCLQTTSRSRLPR